MRKNRIAVLEWVGEEPNPQPWVDWCASVRQLCQLLARPGGELVEGGSPEGTHPVPVCLQGLVQAVQMAVDQFIPKATNWLCFLEPHA